MKNVLIFSLNYYPRFIGGAEVALKEITDRMKDTEFHLIALRFDSELPKEERIGNVVVHRIGYATPHPGISDLNRFPLHLMKGWYQFAAVQEAERLHRIHHMDAIWAMMAHATAIPAGLFKKRHPDVPYLLTLQEGDPPEAIERLFRPVFPLFQAGFTRADALQTISTFLLAWGRRMGASCYGEVVPNGVNGAHFAQQLSSEELAEEQTALGKKEGEVYLVTTSRLVYKNGLDDVIRALAILPKHISFIIFGIGPEEDTLRTLAQTCAVDSRVRFMGAISQEAMPRALSACDIFIRPSRSEGMGNSFIEAMAAGLPVIATQEGGLSDFIYDAKQNPEKPTTAWAVTPNSPESIAAAVTDMLAHPDTVKEVTATAKAMALRDYEWDAVAERMRALFERLYKGASIEK